MPAVDVHAHALIGPAFGFANEQPAAQKAQAEELETFGKESAEINKAQIGTIAPLLTDPGLRLGKMDAQQVDVQLVSPSPQHYHDWADPQTSARITKLVNEGMAELVATSPARLHGLGIVSLHLPELAPGDLVTAMTECGLKGVEISTSAGGRELSHPDLEPFWAAAHEHEALVFIHPWGCTLGARLDRHYLANIVGQPVETTVALSHIIFSGLLDRYPGLRIIAAHGGGYLPYYVGRSDHAWNVRPDSRTPKLAPSEYLRKIYFDSLVYEPRALETLVAGAGADHVLLGTDYPFDMGVDDPVARLRAAGGLSAAQRDLIKGTNAQQLLAI